MSIFIIFCILSLYIYNRDPPSDPVQLPIPVVAPSGPIPSTRFPLTESILLAGPPPPNLDCNVLNGKVMNGTALDSGEYDMLGAYFFLHLGDYVGTEMATECLYYKDIKQILVPTTVSQRLIQYFQTNPAITFSGQLTPLDDFVPRIAKHLYYNYVIRFPTDYRLLKLNAHC